MAENYLTKLLQVAGVTTTPAPDDPAAVRLALEEAAFRVGAQAMQNAASIMARGLALVTPGGDPQPVDAAWLRKFARLAGEVSTVEQTTFWARVFGLEVAFPQTISAATLETLARCDDHDLQLIRRIAPLAVNDFIVMASTTLLEDKGLTVDASSQLEELGLMRPDSGYSKTFDSQRDDAFSTVLLYRDTAIRIEHPQHDRKLALKVRRLTRAGTQICAAVAGNADFDQLMEITRLLRRRGYTVNHSALLHRAPLRNVARHSGFVEIVPFPKRAPRVPPEEVS